MSYDRDLMFKVNISTIIAWKRRYEATGDVKIKVRCPVNKKIIPENTPYSTTANKGYDF